MKKIHNLCLFLFVPLFIAGCGQTLIPGIVDIDKSQPSVTMGVQKGEFQSIDWNAAQAKANKQCQEFGYWLAEPLEATRQSCADSSYYAGQYGGYGGCTVFQIERKYICKE